MAESMVRRRGGRASQRWRRLRLVATGEAPGRAEGGASEEAVRLLEKMQAMQDEEAKQAAAGTTAEPGGRYKPPAGALHIHVHTLRHRLLRIACSSVLG